jgi:hypothetical protein
VRDMGAQSGLDVRLLIRDQVWAFHQETGCLK